MRWKTSHHGHDPRLHDLLAIHDDFKPKFQAVGGTCKGCHDTYRKKKA